MPFETATIAEVLGERGYNTYAVGKWHVVAEDETNMASSKRNWPTGRGFERYYGYLGGETNQWYPDLVQDQQFVDQPADPPKDWAAGFGDDDYHLSRDLVDRAISMIADAKQIAPDRPFFMYFCPGAGHAPHHAPKEWVDKYKGRFDEGYEAIRESILANQKKLGLAAGERRSSRRSTRCSARRASTGLAHRGRRRRAPVGLAARRREDHHAPHGRGVRRVLQLHRPRDRTADRLPRAERGARQHVDRPRSPTTAPRVRAARTVPSTRTRS